MINYSRQGSTIKVSIDTGIPSDTTNGKECFHLEFQWKCDSEMSARLLIEQLRKHKDNSIEEALKDMYAAGYKDGRGHKEKKSWFPTNLKYRFS